MTSHLIAQTATADTEPARAEPIPPAGDGYTVAPAFAVRVASVPVSAPAALRCTRTWQLVDELADGAAWLEREGAALSDALYEVIGTAEGSPKAALVGLRRAVYTGRRPDRRSREVIETLPAGLAARIRAWCDRREQQAADRAALPDTLTADTERAIVALREAAGGAVFRHGLAYASPTLSSRVDAWLAGRTSRRPPRGELLGLARYLVRAAVKTSPHASLTLSGFGTWVGHGPAVAPVEDLSWREVAELDRSVLAPVWSALCRIPEVYARARLRVNPAGVEDGDRIWFLGSGPAEPLRSVPATPAVRQVLSIVRDQRVTAGELPAARPLVDAGLLEPLPPYDEWSEDPVAELADWLASVPGAATGAEQVLRRITAAGQHAGSHGQRPRPEVVRDALAQLLSSGGGSTEGASGTEVLPWLPDKNLVASTSVLTGTAGTCATPAWQQACDDLDTVRRALGLFNQDLPVTLAAAAFFLDRYGQDAAVPLLDLYRDVYAGTAGHPLRTLLGSPLAPATTAVGEADIPGLADLAAARRKLWQAIGAGPSPEPVVRVNPATVADLTAAAPQFVRPPESACCYVQPWGDPDDVCLVLGVVTAGYGRGLSRLHRAMATAGGQAPPVEHLRAPLAHVDTLECPGIMGGGIDLRTATADRTLRYPGTTSSAAAGLSLADLVASYDPDQGRLVCRDRTGRRVRPVHLGMSAQHWLPPGLRYLCQVFGEPAVAMVPGWILRGGALRPPAGQVELWPRLEIGRVTLARQCARLRARDFPTPAATEHEAHYLCRLAAWLAEHGIGRRFFARVIDPRAGLVASTLGKGRKPLYVDVTDHLSLTGFLRAIRDPEELLVLEEVLPDPADAPTYGEHGQRVTEYIIQLSAREAAQ